jgi:hypothetical protein
MSANFREVQITEMTDFERSLHDNWDIECPVQRARLRVYDDGKVVVEIKTPKVKLNVKQLFLPQNGNTRIELVPE